MYVVRSKFSETVVIADDKSKYLKVKPLEMDSFTHTLYPGQIDKLKVASQESLREAAKNGFQLCFQKLYERWQKCIVPKGTTLKVDMLRCSELFRNFQKHPYGHELANNGHQPGLQKGYRFDCIVNVLPSFH
ncbi:hypothetical protein TNCV_3628541 [Trichonephila clavipes]|nr:hypothetical protein TNCV_3628541 [Trichonephila clavipes]